MANDEIVVDARGHRCPVPTLRQRPAQAQGRDRAAMAARVDDDLRHAPRIHYEAARGLAAPVSRGLGSRR